MREILFRGKDPETGKWYEGQYIHLHKTTYAVKGDYDANPGNEIHQIVFERMTDWGLPNEYLRADVDPETVCQYIGLVDKNGKKIFQGDILTSSKYPFSSKGERNYYALVVCFDNSPAFGLETCVAADATVAGISDGNTEYIEDWEPSYWEVVGNIFDTPELLR